MPSADRQRTIVATPSHCRLLTIITGQTMFGWMLVGCKAKQRDDRLWNIHMTWTQDYDRFTTHRDARYPELVFQWGDPAHAPISWFNRLRILWLLLRSRKDSQ